MEALITLDDSPAGFAILPREQTLELRSQYIPTACKLHFEKNPMKITRAKGQFLYDDGDGKKVKEYLDCVNCVAHVGHCNPTVVTAAKDAMLKMGNVILGMSDKASEYVAQLKTTMPKEIDTFLFVTSGSEANDLAIQMARQYTGGYDVVSVESSFHGGLSETCNVSPRQFTSPRKCPNWVHVLQCPDLYRGEHRSNDDDNDDSVAIEKYCQNAKKVIDAAVQKDHRKLACFICEPLLTSAGMIIPPSQWFHSIYSRIRSHGGLCIADEAQTGLGRCGESWWCFQTFDNLVPDIITIGKPLGNGHPMACIATRSCIAAKLVSPGSSNYACDLVSAAVGLAVLNAVRNLELQSNARAIGSFLLQSFRGLASDFGNIGQVRGMGLMIGVEIVYNQDSRKPARAIAEKICYGLLEHHGIVVANDGIYKNVLIFTPPMCIMMNDAYKIHGALRKVLEQIESEPEEELSPAPSTSLQAMAAAASLGVQRDTGLTFDDVVRFVRNNVGQRPGSSTSISSRQSNETEVASTSSGIGGGGTISSSPAARSLDDEIDDGGYTTSHSFASMD